MRKTAFQQGAGALLNSAQESFCNARKTSAQLLAWALAPLAATEPRQKADSLTARRRRKRRRRSRRRRCGKRLGSETQGSPSPGAWDSASVVCGGGRQCPLLSGDCMLFLPRYFPETSSPTAHNLLIPPCSNRNYSLTPLLY